LAACHSADGLIAHLPLPAGLVDAGDRTEELFDLDDPFDHPLWRKAEAMADAPPRPSKGYVT
jgi:hypothetical protein